MHAAHGVAIDPVPLSARSSCPTEELLSVPGSDITQLSHYHSCPRQRFSRQRFVKVLNLCIFRCRQNTAANTSNGVFGQRVVAFYNPAGSAVTVRCSVHCSV